MASMVLNAPLQASVSRSDAEPLLRDGFVVRDLHTVAAFVSDHLFLLPLLREAREKTQGHIPDARIALSVFRDPEGRVAPYLVGVVESQVPLLERFALQEILRQNWWLGASDAANDAFHFEL